MQNMELGIIGTSVWQQNMPLIESLTIDREQRTETLERIKTELGMDELVYLATCNRVEFIFATSEETSSVQLLHRLIDFFFKEGKSTSFFPNDFYQFRGKDAITHLFRTASSLESLVLGENQITGQIKTAQQDAFEAGLSGIVLNGLIQEALNIARKVKSKTSIGKGALSMASLASVELGKAMKSVDKPHLVLVGSGPMLVKMAKYINDNFSGRLLFVNRTVEKAEKLADEFGGKAMSLDEFRAAPPSVDAIISATAAVEPVFDKSFLERISLHCKNVVCVDLAVPRDFSLDFQGQRQLILIDIPWLKPKSQTSLRQKFVEAGKADEIVRTAVNDYLSNRVEISLKPIFNESFQESMELAQKAFGDLFSKRVQSLEKDDQEAVLRLVAKLIGQSTFGPIKRLSRQMANGRQEIDVDELGGIRRQAV
jgi:glutamyl-tRNA reductase